MKDYKKIYSRFKKEIKKELKAHYNSDYSTNSRCEVIEYYENSYAITVLELLLNWTEELEGKRCLMLNMNHKKFKEWKEKIQIKKKGEN